MKHEWTQLLRLVPGQPGQAIPWAQIGDTVLAPYAAAMADTPQQSEYHGEGDVWTHTRMVCERLIALHDFWLLPARQREELFLAALLHDIGKPQTTKEQDGRLISPHHGAAGMQLARKLLWTDCDLAGTSQAQCIRETICLLIRYHTAPVNALRQQDPELYLRKIAANGHLAADFTLHMLCLLAQADVLGRIAYDTLDLCGMVQLCIQQAEESLCLHGPYSFPDSHTAYAYLSGRSVPPDSPLYDDTWGEVVLLCGLPGTGKDTWTSRNLPGLPMLSLDNIRREMCVKPTDDQGRVIQEGQKRARSLLAAHQPFVFNGTNVTEMMRGKWARLCEQYHARVRMVYLETDWQTNLRRNADRPYAVPESVIGGLLDKATLPEAFEAQRVEWITV